MSKKPESLFAFEAVKTAYIAIVGRLLTMDRMRLCEAALTFVPRDEKAVDATLTFLKRADYNQHTAGELLRDFICEWTESHGLKAPVPPEFYEWQKRADLQ